MCIHTQEYYSTFKKEILTFMTWINLEVILNEISQTNTACYHLHVESKTKDSQTQKQSRKVVVRGLRQGEIGRDLQKDTAF